MSIRIISAATNFCTIVELVIDGDANFVCEQIDDLDEVIADVSTEQGEPDERGQQLS